MAHDVVLGCSFPQKNVLSIFIVRVIILRSIVSRPIAYRLSPFTARRFGNKCKPDETDASANVTGSFPDSLSLTSYKTDARWQQSVSAISPSTVQSDPRSPTILQARYYLFWLTIVFFVWKTTRTIPCLKYKKKIWKIIYTIVTQTVARCGRVINQLPALSVKTTRSVASTRTGDHPNIRRPVLQPVACICS